MGRWLWRGYLQTGGHLIGRWRDTFTAENLRGYEGAFGMVRAGDIFYPSHFPKRMEDSLGVDHSGVPGHFAGHNFPSDHLSQRPTTSAPAKGRGPEASLRRDNYESSPPSNGYDIMRHLTGSDHLRPQTGTEAPGPSGVRVINRDEGMRQASPHEKKRDCRSPTSSSVRSGTSSTALDRDDRDESLLPRWSMAKESAVREERVETSMSMSPDTLAKRKLRPWTD